MNVLKSPILRLVLGSSCRLKSPLVRFQPTMVNFGFQLLHVVLLCQSGNNGFFKNAQTDGNAAYFWNSARQSNA